MKFKSNSNSFQSYESAGELLPPFLLSFLFCPNFPKMFCLLVTLVTLVAMANLVHGQSCAAMSQLERIGRSRSAGRRPDGRCYFHVSYMLEDARYGNFAPGNFLQYVPAGFIAEAYQFAQWMNTGNNARLAGLQRMKLDDVAKAPAGAIVVVRAGTCGTAHPTAGDIAISSGDGVSFWNGGDMRYCQSFRPGNNFVLGIYQPLECSAEAGGDGGEACHTCILHGGGAGCSDQRCTPCGGTCTACLTNGGGLGCLERCCGGKAPVKCTANGSAGTCKKTTSCKGSAVLSSAGAKGCELLPEDETCCVAPSTPPFVGDSTLCEDCVAAGGGARCVRACAGCGSKCAMCINSGGGKACAEEKCRACTLPETRYANSQSSAINVACSRLSESFDGGKWKFAACSRCEYKQQRACRTLCGVVAAPAAGAKAQLKVGQCYDMSTVTTDVAPLPDGTPCSADTGTCSAGECSSQANPCSAIARLGADEPESEVLSDAGTLAVTVSTVAAAFMAVMP